MSCSRIDTATVIAQTAPHFSRHPPPASTATAPLQTPMSHESEQHSPYLMHMPPTGAHVAADPPQTFFRQSLSQHSEIFSHCAPSARQLGSTQVPP
jgi:hypothetical protein